MILQAVLVQLLLYHTCHQATMPLVAVLSFVMPTTSQTPMSPVKQAPYPASVGEYVLLNQPCRYPVVNKRPPPPCLSKLGRSGFKFLLAMVVV